MRRRGREPEDPGVRVPRRPSAGISAMVNCFSFTAHRSPAGPLPGCAGPDTKGANGGPLLTAADDPSLGPPGRTPSAALRVGAAPPRGDSGADVAELHALRRQPSTG